MFKAKIKIVKYVSATALVPRLWKEWFWGEASEDAPFSWGDNDHTLVTGARFLQHCLRTLETPAQKAMLTERVQAMVPAGVYIDLET